MTAAEYLTEVEARAERATKGPWKYDAMANVGENWLLGVINTGVDVDGKAQHIVTTDRLRASDCTSGGPIEDSTFIAASRTDVPRLVRMLRVAIVTLASRADYDEQGNPSNADAVALEKIDAIANE